MRYTMTTYVLTKNISLLSSTFLQKPTQYIFEKCPLCVCLSVTLYEVAPQRLLHSPRFLGAYFQILYFTTAMYNKHQP